MAELLNTFIQYVPRVLGALAMVLVGLALAVVARRGVWYLLRRFGFDELCRRVGVTKLIGESSRRTPTGFVGQVVFYAVLVFAILAALGPLGLDFLASTLNQVVLYAPRVVAAILILVLGTSAAGLVSEIVGRWMTGVGSAGAIKNFVRFALIFLFAVLAASVLEIDVTILIVVTVIALGGVALTAALALGLGLRGLSSNVAAGKYISEGVSEGDEIRIGDVAGTVEEIGYAMTRLRTAEGKTYLVPNAHFLDRVVEKTGRAADRGGRDPENPE